MFTNTGLTVEDRILIKSMRFEKRWGAKRLMREFPNRNWRKTTLNNFLAKVEATGDHKPARKSGRPRSARNEQFIPLVASRTISELFWTLQAVISSTNFELIIKKVIHVFFPFFMLLWRLETRDISQKLWVFVWKMALLTRFFFDFRKNAIKSTKIVETV